MNVFFSSTNGKRDGRSSRFYENQAAAQGVVDKQNDKAKHLGIDQKIKYQLSTTTNKDMETKEIVKA